DVRDAPDPNLGMHGRSGAIPGTGVTPSNAAPDPKAAPEKDQDSLGNLIARLDSGPPPTAEQQVSTPQQVATPAPPSEAAQRPAAQSQQGTYFLQAGAFRNPDEAEAMRARVIMLGMSAEVQQATVNGSTWHRVRVGPFSGLDEMNKARARLGGEKIETSVVRKYGEPFLTGGTPGPHGSLNSFEFRNHHVVNATDPTLRCHRHHRSRYGVRAGLPGANGAAVRHDRARAAVRHGGQG